MDLGMEDECKKNLSDLTDVLQSVSAADNKVAAEPSHKGLAKEHPSAVLPSDKGQQQDKPSAVLPSDWKDLAKANVGKNCHSDGNSRQPDLGLMQHRDRGWRPRNHRHAR